MADITAHEKLATDAQTDDAEIIFLCDSDKILKIGVHVHCKYGFNSCNF